MKQITKRIVAEAFLNRKTDSLDNTTTDGKSLFLFGNKIAYWKDKELWIKDCGWCTPTTRERLDALPNVNLSIKNGKWILNGKPWDGSPIQVA